MPSDYQLVYPTFTWIAQSVPDAAIPPELYRPPERGWLTWIADLSGVPEPGKLPRKAEFIPLDSIQPFNPWANARDALPPAVSQMYRMDGDPFAALEAWARDPSAVSSYAELVNLADALERDGLSAPVRVRPMDEPDTYLLTAGERRWWAHQLLEMQGRRVKNGTPGHIEAFVANSTISGNMNESTAVAMAQWIALRTSLHGKPGNLDGLASEILDPDKADESAAFRAAFESGRPIPVTSSQMSVERFATFTPVLRHDADAKQYIVGEGESAAPFDAVNHDEALVKAAKWYDATRAKEIEEQLDAAAEMTKQRVSPLYLDLAVLQLGFDDQLRAEDGSLVAQLSWAHGFYMVVSSKWCYADPVSIKDGKAHCMGKTGAVRLGIMGAANDGNTLALWPEQMPTYAELEGWQGDGEGGFQWASGQVKKATDAASVQKVLKLAKMQSGQAWKIAADDEPLAIACVQDGLTRVAVLDLKGNMIVDSPVSETIRNALTESYDQDDPDQPPQPVPEDMQPGSLLAWATWRAMRAANRAKSEGEE